MTWHPVDASPMIKRLVAAPLWFISVGWAYALAAYFLGLPADGGVIVGALAAAFVFIDPTGAFWGPPPPPPLPPPPLPLPSPCRLRSPRGMMRVAAGSSIRRSRFRHGTWNTP